MEDADTKRDVPIKKKELGAKDVSLMAKTLAVFVVLAGHIMKWTGLLVDASSSEICACAFTIMGIFGTVDINILADKFSSKRQQ